MTCHSSTVTGNAPPNIRILVRAPSVLSHLKVFNRTRAHPTTTFIRQFESGQVYLVYTGLPQPAILQDLRCLMSFRPRRASGSRAPERWWEGQRHEKNVPKSGQAVALWFPFFKISKMFKQSCQKNWELPNDKDAGVGALLMSGSHLHLSWSMVFLACSKKLHIRDVYAGRGVHM